ncbi:MAG: hypothetical protein HZB18_03020 [Chloroflexi bacterium]|nr:hypothetical protein [Chloroflexota bacterium]
MPNLLESRLCTESITSTFTRRRLPAAFLFNPFYHVMLSGAEHLYDDLRDPRRTGARRKCRYRSG